jgi:hypothetical protein
MGSARPWFVLAVALVPAGASADNHFADFSAGVSDSRLSSLWGGQFTISKVIGRPPRDWKPHDPPFKPLRWSALLDLNVDGGTHHLAHAHQLAYAAGLRYTLAGRHNYRLLPFAQTLIGGNHNTGESDLVGDYAAFVFGIGLDILLNAHPRHDKYLVNLVAFRVQGEWTEPFGVDANGYPRVSVGVVFRIKEHAFDRP